MQPVSNNTLRNMLIITIIIGILFSTLYLIIVDSYTFSTPIALSLQVFQHFKMFKKHSDSNKINNHDEYSFNVNNEIFLKPDKKEGRNKYIEEKKELIEVLEKGTTSKPFVTSTGAPKDLKTEMTPTEKGSAGGKDKGEHFDASVEKEENDSYFEEKKKSNPMAGEKSKSKPKELETDPAEKGNSGEKDEGHHGKRKCKFDKKTLGPVHIDFSPADLEELRKKELDFVKRGGQWSPTDCVPREELAMVIPYRNREQHLGTFLRHMHKFLKSQNLKYRIFVIEQDDDNKFNRGKLMNVGFKEALKRHPFKCFAFHDVDLMPEDSRNDYGCPNSPRHLSVGVDRFEYVLLYDQLFGGVEMFKTPHFQKINGFSNMFWGWGGEDDNLYYRVKNYFHSPNISRPSIQIGRYKMLIHVPLEPSADEGRFQVLKDSRHMERVVVDGLNSLKYKIKESLDLPLFTLIKVDLTEH